MKNETVIRYKESSTNLFDIALDTTYFTNGNPEGAEFSSLSNDNTNLAINTLPDHSTNDIIALYTYTNKAGPYAIDLTEFIYFDSEFEVIIYDNKLGQHHHLKNGAYSFQGEITDLESRFSIQIKASDISSIIEIIEQEFEIKSNETNIIMNFNNRL